MAEQAPKYFIVAESLAHARNSAEIDWGWPRERGKWIDPEGHRVEYLKDVTKLHALKDVRIYRGYRWYALIAPHHIDEHIAAGRAMFVDPKIVPRT